MIEIEPTEENLNDPYVLQLLEELGKRDDQIKLLEERIDELLEEIINEWKELTRAWRQLYKITTTPILRNADQS